MRRYMDPGLDDEAPLGPYPGIAPGKRTLTQGLPPKPAANHAGAPLDPGIAAHVGGLLHADFSGVRVHDDPAAQASSAAMGARAFAQGTDIFLGAGESGSDLALMAHELTHVVQQGGATTAAPQAKSAGGSGGGGDLEREADMVAERAVSGDALDWLIGPAPSAPRVQCKRPDADPGAGGDGAERTGFLVATEDIFLHRETAWTLARTPIAIRATMVVREREHPGGKTYAGFQYVVTAGELHGWAERRYLRPVPPKLVADADASLGEGTPNTELPTLAAEDYDQLAVMFWDAPVYGRTMSNADRKKAEPITTIRQMEMVVFLDKVQEHGVSWQRVRLLREPAVIGWVTGHTANSVAPMATATGELDGTTYLVEGDDDPLVLELETQLAALEPPYDVGTPDTLFDATTKLAVQAFQRDHGVTPVDGEFGPKTAEALAAAAAEASGAEPGSEEPEEPEGSPVIPVGSWRGGFELSDRAIGRALTPDGKRDHESHGTATQDSRSILPAGPCEVLVGGDGAPIGVVDVTDGVACYYVRAAAARSHDAVRDRETSTLPLGGAGWVPAAAVTGAGNTELSPIATELAQLCPDGITVVFVSNFDDRENEQTLTFLREAAGFAAAQNAVAISGGNVVTGGVNLTTEKHEIITILNTIQHTLRGDLPDVPAWLRVAHLAFFTHGWQSGLQLGRRDNDGDHLMNQRDQAPYFDLEGWALTLTNYVHSDVKVSMFACSTGEKPGGERGMWEQQDAERGGEGSFADVMADNLVAAGATDTRILGHTTIGHTTDNYASRLFDGSEEGGRNLWSYVALPLESWLGGELAELAENGRANPPAELDAMAWSRFTAIISKDDPAQIQTRMNADPEIFRAELRLRIKSWMPQAFLDKGILPRVATLRGKNEGEINPQYNPWPRAPDRAGKIPPHAELTRRKGEAIWRDEQWCYPITWVGDPGDVQAYLGRWWMIITLPDPI